MSRLSSKFFDSMAVVAALSSAIPVSEEQVMTTTATNNPGTNSNNSTGNGTGNGKSREPLTPVAAITKISKILDQLAPSDRKRVLLFLSEPGATSE